MAARHIAMIAPFCLAAACAHAPASPWITLFNGTSTAAWRGYLKPDLPAGWEVLGGALTRVGPGGDIITKEQFDNFELELEWQIERGGNSGVFFHVREDPALKYVWLSGPEMQVLDDAVHPDGRNPLTSAGSNFAVHAPAPGATHAAGTWNHARLIVNGSHVEHWLNNRKVVEYELWSEDWKRRVAASKFKDYPEYGLARTGHIALQDHGDRVAFRRIRIRRL